MSLIAVTHILYNSVLYKPGDRLPDNDPEMRKAWIDAGTAYEGSEDSQEKEKAVQESENDEDNEPTLEEVLKKLPNKAAVIEYANMVGVEVGQKDTVEVIKENILKKDKE